MVYVLHLPTYDVWFLVTSTFFSILSLQCHADISMYRVNTNQQIDGGYRTYASRFGPPIDPEGFEGFVTYNSTGGGTGCDLSLIDTPPNAFANHKWILLLQRGNCSFVEKVKNAQLKQYDMVIVFNNVSSVESMHGRNANDIYIPSVFVSQNTGLALMNKYQYLNNVYVIVEDDSNFPFDINGDLLVPFAIIVSVFFITMISFTICKCIRDRRRALRHRLPASSLRKIPIEKFSSKTSRYETCAICLDDYVDGEKLRILPCSHAYHTKCVDPWLTRNRRVCPVCKRKVFAANEVPIEGSDSDSDSDNDERTHTERTPLVRPQTSQEAQSRRAFIHSILAPLTHLTWQTHESTIHSSGSDISSQSGSFNDVESNVEIVVPASTFCSINSQDNGSASAVLNSFSFPGTSTVQLPHRSNYNIQNRNDVSS